METRIYTKEQTQELAALILAELATKKSATTATVLLLHGDLGAGKTTLVQNIGLASGVLEKIQSPTFGILKRYPILNTNYPFDALIHIDAYRLAGKKELTAIGWHDYYADNRNLICIEWPQIIIPELTVPALSVWLTHRGFDSREIKWSHGS